MVSRWEGTSPIEAIRGQAPFPYTLSYICNSILWQSPPSLLQKVSGVSDGVFLCSEQRGKKLLQQLKDPRKYIQEYPYQSPSFFIMRAMTKVTIERGGEGIAQETYGDQGQQTKAHGKIGRNDPCWCGSGRKYKRCHYPN